jgi:hypothetical protein
MAGEVDVPDPQAGVPQERIERPEDLECDVLANEEPLHPSVP